MGAVRAHRIKPLADGKSAVSPDPSAFRTTVSHDSIAFMKYFLISFTSLGTRTAQFSRVLALFIPDGSDLLQIWSCSLTGTPLLNDICE